MEFALGTRKGTTGGLSANNNGQRLGQRGDQFFNAMSVYGGDEWDAQNIINSPFTGFGQMTEGRANYTGQAVIEDVDFAVDSEGVHNEFIPIWTPVVRGAFENPADKKLYDYKAIVEGSEGKDEVVYGNFEEWVDTTLDRTGRKDVEAKVAASLPAGAKKIAYK